MKILDGKACAHAVEAKIAHALSNTPLPPPALAFISVGTHPSSTIYLKRKQKKCQEVGILSVVREFPEHASEKDLIKEIHCLNQDPTIDGILIQQPLPSSLSALHLTSHIDPRKDVDGFHPLNMGKLLLGDTTGFMPCTPWGIITLLHHYGITTHEKHVVIVGRSNIVGKPLAALLVQKAPYGNATVTIAHTSTQSLADVCKSADILISAVGIPHLIKAPMVRPNSVVIDVGINRLPSGAIVGDVDFDTVSQISSYITPVPGGIGPMTIAMLLSNTLLSYQRKYAQ